MVTAEEYLQGARDVMKNGIKVQYNYKGEMRNGYVKCMGIIQREMQNLSLLELMVKEK